MQIWEYRTFPVEKTTGASQAASKEPIGWVLALNGLGQDGWEAVGLAVLEKVILVLLKRPVVR